MTDLIKALGFDDEIDSDVLDEQVTSLAVRHMLEFPQGCEGCAERFDGETIVIHKKELYCVDCYIEIREE
ncbi:hypothetical protein ACWV3O_004531 [Vibrio parahaemolyticus]